MRLGGGGGEWWGERDGLRGERVGEDNWGWGGCGGMMSFGINQEFFDWHQFLRQWKWDFCRTTEFCKEMRILKYGNALLSSSSFLLHKMHILAVCCHWAVHIMISFCSNLQISRNQSINTPMTSWKQMTSWEQMTSGKQMTSWEPMTFFWFIFLSFRTCLQRQFSNVERWWKQILHSK